MTLPVSIRVNVRAPFPSQVKGLGFVTVGKANGAWTIAPDYRVLAPNIEITPTQIIALQDSVTGAFAQIGAAAIVSSALSAARVITTPGTVNVLPTDVVLLFEKTSSGASTVNLPSSAIRGGTPVVIKDLTGDANTNNITVVPFSTETIDGFMATAAATNGVAVISTDYGAIELYPLSAGGWYVRSRL